MIDFGKILDQALDLLAPKEGAVKPQEVKSQEIPAKMELTHPGGMKVGITAFGLPSRFNLRTALNEFKFYMENNSKLKLDIKFVQESNLSPSEIPRYNAAGVCYMVTPQSLSPANKAKLPVDVKTQIVVYDTQDRVNCFGGLQWPYAVPFICIPYNNSSSWDYGWQTSLAPALMHEFNHAVYTILKVKGYKGLPDIDKANAYGYTIQNDPGWLRFRKYCLGLITQEMADALMKN